MEDLAFVAMSINNGWRPGDDITFPGETDAGGDVPALPSPQRGATSATVPDGEGAEPTSIVAGNPDTLASDGPDWREEVDRLFERYRAAEDGASFEPTLGRVCTMKVCLTCSRPTTSQLLTPAVVFLMCHRTWTTPFGQSTGT